MYLHIFRFFNSMNLRVTRIIKIEHFNINKNTFGNILCDFAMENGDASTFKIYVFHENDKNDDFFHDQTDE